MPIKTKVDKIIRSTGSISIQDFIELSNFDNEGFYNLEENSKYQKMGILLHRQKLHHFLAIAYVTSLLLLSIIPVKFTF